MSPLRGSTRRWRTSRQRCLRNREARHSSLEGFGRFIDKMLEEERSCWRKQRHTGVRILDRLRNDHGFKGSCPTVQRYVKEKRYEMAAARGLAGFLPSNGYPVSARSTSVRPTSR